MVNVIKLIYYTYNRVKKKGSNKNLEFNQYDDYKNPKMLGALIKTTQNRHENTGKCADEGMRRRNTMGINYQILLTREANKHSNGDNNR